MEGNGESVGFIAEFAQEHESGAGEGEDDFAVVVDGEAIFGFAGDLVGDEDDFLFFGESDHGDAESEGVSGFEGGAELAFAAIDHHEIREFGEFGVAIEVAAESSRDDFVHHDEVVWFFGVPLNFEAAVFVFGWLSVFGDDH